MSQRDPYEVLGVSRTATGEEIRAAYRKLARKFHPDVNRSDPSAEDKFKEIGQAYEILSDDEKRSRFDQFGTTDPQMAGGGDFMGSDFGDIFEMFFGAGQQTGRRRSMARDGIDVQSEIELTLQDVLTGVKRELQIERHEVCDACGGFGSENGKPPETCPTCRGAGIVGQVRNTFIGQVRTQTTCPTCQGGGVVIKAPCKSCNGRAVKMSKVTIPVEVPAGVEDGARLQMSGHGGAGIMGGRRGDLYVRLNVAEMEPFERHGTTLFQEAEISFSQAALGDTITVPGVEAGLELEIPAGTQPGENLTIKQAGLPPLHGGKRGEMIVRVQVRVPEKLNAAQEQALKAFAEASGEQVPKGNGGILGGLFGKKK